MPGLFASDRSANLYRWPAQIEREVSQGSTGLALVQYQATIQNAFREVSDSLVEYQR